MGFRSLSIGAPVVPVLLVQLLTDFHAERIFMQATFYGFISEVSGATAIKPAMVLGFD